MLTRNIRYLLVVFVTGLLAIAPASAFKTPMEGDRLPDFDLDVPQDPEARQYLGLADQGKFKIPQIKAEIVIIEIFSMYCPHCQREAPTLNDFYHRIEGSKTLRGRVKLIGIGVGNSAFEIDFFRKQYKIPFPLFADGEFTIHKLIGEVRTPYFFGIAIQPDGSHRVYYSKLGGSKSADALLTEMIQQAGVD